MNKESFKEKLKETMIRVNFVVSIFIIFTIFSGIAQSWVLQDEPASIGNITVGNITISDGSKSNVVLTTDTKYLQNTSVLNSSSGTWKRNPNSSIELIAAGGYSTRVVFGCVFGTVYQNTNDTSIEVNLEFSNGANQEAVLYTDSNNPPTTEVSQYESTVAVNTATIGGIILPGHYWKPASITATIQSCSIVR